MTKKDLIAALVTFADDTPIKLNIGGHLVDASQVYGSIVDETGHFNPRAENGTCVVVIDKD